MVKSKSAQNFDDWNDETFYIYDERFNEAETKGARSGDVSSFRRQLAKLKSARVAPYSWRQGAAVPSPPRVMVLRV